MAKSKKQAAPQQEANEEKPVIIEEVVSSETENNTEQAAPQQEAKTLQVGTVTSTIIRSSFTPPVEDPNLVTLLINYPEGFKGKKFFKNGDQCKTSPESADKFIKMGIATKVEK